jgi:hypothetical protein
VVDAELVEAEGAEMVGGSVVGLAVDLAAETAGEGAVDLVAEAAANVGRDPEVERAEALDLGAVVVMEAEGETAMRKAVDCARRGRQC